MEITRVRVHKMEKEGSRLKGYATVTIDDSFVVGNIKIIEGKNRWFCQMPNHKVVRDGEEVWEDTVYPTNKETRDMFENKILEEYNKTEEE